MASVFVLQHVHTTDDDAEDVKLIGVYSTRDLADAAVEKLTRVAGFADAPDGFHIDEYQIDDDHWVEGFATPSSPTACGAGSTAPLPGVPAAGAGS